MAPETDAIGSVPQKEANEIDSMATMIEMIATLPGFIPPKIDWIGTETEFIAAEIEY